VSALRSGLCVLLLSACASGGGHTGVLHGDVTVAEDGSVQGVFVWEFFAPEGPEPALAEAHVCARLLEVAGEPSPDAACEDCVVAAALTISEVEHDCADSMGTDPSLASMDRIWLRPGSGGKSGHFPDDRWSWSLGWDGGTPSEEGVAWDEGFEFGEPPDHPDVLLGRRVRLAPESARRLDSSLR